MTGQSEVFAVDYLLRRTGIPSVAQILASGKEVGELRRAGERSYVMDVDGNERWVLSRKVHGEVRPFSLDAEEVPSDGASGGRTIGRRLAVRNHLFQHHDRVYMLTNSPEGRPLGELLLGKKYICRLDGFPVSEVENADQERSGLGEINRRFRGYPVGEMSGFGEGHQVRLRKELEDVGLPLAAACFLLYSPG